jgi:DNA-binding IclR family transcriptional regulator
MSRNISRKPAYSVPALEKGLDILEALSVAKMPQTLADLARLCNRSRSEIFRMVDTLEKREYIVRDPVSGGYELTLKIYQLAHTHTPMDHLLKAAHFPMRDLASALHESCHLCVLSNDDLLVIAESESPNPIRLSVAIGYRAAPLSTTSGRLLLAMLSDIELEAILRRDKFFASLSPRKQRSFRRELAGIRRAGFCVASSAHGITVDVSCLVGSREIGVTAALGVPFISGGVNQGKEESLVTVIQEHADQITRALGLAAKPLQRAPRRKLQRERPRA